MAIPTRVPMPVRPSWIAADDVMASAHRSPGRAGIEFTLTVAEEVLPQIAREVIPHVAERLAEQVVYRHQAEIESAVHSFILDRAWAEPIIRDEISKTVRAIIHDMLLNSKVGDALNGGG